MKNKIKLTILMLCITASFVNAQTVTMNGDTISPPFSSHWVDTIYYCGSINVKITGNDTLGICNNGIWSCGDTTSGNKDSILISGNFIPHLPIDSLYFLYNNPAPFHWKKTKYGHWFPDSNCTGQITKVHFIKKYPSSKICWTTVDSSSKHNLIIWDTTGLTGQAIDSFKIYFYNASSQWQKIAERPFKDSIYYMDDTNSINNPNKNNVRYLLTGVTSCGGEEPIAKGTWQNTLFIINNSGTFSWSGTGYQIQNVVTPVLTYYLYRDTISNGNWQIIDSVSGIQNQMTDLSYSKYPKGRWYVGAKLNASGCPAAPAKKMTSASGTISRSNQISLNVTGINDITDEKNVEIYPNPSNSIFHIKGNGIVTVYDLTGRIIEVFESRNESEFKMPTSGVYIVKLNNEYFRIVSQ